LMATCPLTVNFTACKMETVNGVQKEKGWFVQPCTYESYKQGYEIFKGEDEFGNPIDLAMADMGGQSASDRTKTETKKIVHAEPQRGNITSGAVSRFSEPGRLKSVDDTKMKPTNPNFVGASRPRYAALNYTYNPNGAVANPLYGYSCFVLKPHLRQLATYCGRDSISPDVTAQTICTLNTLGALLVWMKDETLINLDKARQ